MGMILSDYRHHQVVPGCNCPDCYGESDSEFDYLDDQGEAEAYRDDSVAEWQGAFERGEVAA